MTAPHETDLLRYRAVPVIVLAVERHRRQMAELLDGLDELGRAVVSASVSALATGRLDTAALMAHLADHLRAGDDQLSALVSYLESYQDRAPIGGAVRPCAGPPGSARPGWRAGG